jgi:hypothetical protein
MAGKMDAVGNRAAARDFLDIDTAVSSGRYTPGQLCDLAQSRQKYLSAVTCRGDGTP